MPYPSLVKFSKFVARLSELKATKQGIVSTTYAALLDEISLLMLQTDPSMQSNATDVLNPPSKYSSKCE